MHILFYYGKMCKKGNVMRGECFLVPAFQMENAVLTVTLPTEVDHPVSELIRRETDRYMNERYVRQVIFDFRETSFMDSSGIGMLMGRFRALGMQKDCIMAVCVSDRLERLLRLSGVHKYIRIEK